MIPRIYNKLSERQKFGKIDDMKNEAIVYTDGGCQPNPGHGVWCCIIQWDGREMVATGKEECSTTPRVCQMEL